MDEFDFLDAISSGGSAVGQEEDSLLTALNPAQRDAVLHDEGPLLILAGAGSGKTRVITYRIAYLMKRRGASPFSILAITFTNKAAAEMKDRVRELIGDAASSMWIGTFHSMMARLLRRHGELLGFQKNFAILDTDDQLKLVKNCISELDLNDKVFVPRTIQGAISRAKNEMIGVQEFEKEAGKDYHKQKISGVYKKYQEKLMQANSMDFDDLLFYGVLLFSENPEVLSYYQEMFRYILVDEYQDTNHAQYRFIRLLAKKYGNLCVVGDDDQSIYSFRGANIRNILDFEKDFKKTKVIKLEQNYRSTSNVLAAANSIIKNNAGRKNKELWTKADSGEKITHYVADHHGLEAWFIVNQIQKWVRTGSGNYADAAILYRVNALSRTIEGALREQGIPYRIYGGFRFYDRKEIKDVLAYLRLVVSSLDIAAFDRIINVPRRGIGDASLVRIHEIAAEEQISCLKVCQNAASYPSLSRVSAKLQQFSWLIMEFREKVAENQMSFSEFVEYVQDHSGLVQEIIEQKEKKGDMVDRIEILRELLSEAVEFQNRRKKENPNGKEMPEQPVGNLQFEDPFYDNDLAGLLQSYLETAALYSEGDSESEEEDFVRLLTIHSAKGLEFPVVFLAGVEEGIFPGHRSLESEESMEEERRLAYVAVTRAKKKLYITTAQSRMLFGQTQQLKPSRFIGEVDSEYKETIGAARTMLSNQTGEGERGALTRDTAGDSGSQSDKRGFSGQRPVARNDSARTAFPGSSSGENSDKTDKDYLLPDQIHKDMRVFHPRFGAGKVLSVEKIAGDALVCVFFDNKMKRNMLAKQGRLKACH